MKQWIVIWIIIKYTIIPCEPTTNKYGIKISNSSYCYETYRDTLMQTFDTESDADTFIWGMVNYPQIEQYSKSSLHTINTADVINALYHTSNNVYIPFDSTIIIDTDTVDVKN